MTLPPANSQSRTASPVLMGLVSSAATLLCLPFCCSTTGTELQPCTAPQLPGSTGASRTLRLQTQTPPISAAAHLVLFVAKVAGGLGLFGPGVPHDGVRPALPPHRHRVPPRPIHHLQNCQPLGSLQRQSGRSMASCTVSEQHTLSLQDCRACMQGEARTMGIFNPQCTGFTVVRQHPHAVQLMRPARQRHLGSYSMGSAAACQVPSVRWAHRTGN